MPRALALLSLLLCTGGCRFDTRGLVPRSSETTPELGPRDLTAGDPSPLDGDGPARDRPGPDLAPSCSDGVQNGGESDVDCGGPCPKKCTSGKGCKKHVECESGICASATSTCRPCAGKPLDGFCWYRGAQSATCAATCAAHGGCDLAGTRDYAGSAGSDAQCVNVLGLFGLQSLPHQSWSNNALGCQLCFPSKPHTYWSAPPLGQVTTCDAAGGPPSSCELMCACNE